MKRTQPWRTESRGAALAAIAVLGLPVLAATLIVARAAALTTVMVLLLAAAAALVFSPRMRSWVNARIEPVLFHKGLRLGTDVAMSPGHAWARGRSGEVFVGADDLIQAALGPVEAVDAPRPGTHVRRGDPLFTLKRGDRRVDVRSPLTGVVLDPNPLLAEQPGTVNHDPFGSGWAVRMRADDVPEERDRLLRGEPAMRWFRREVDRLIDVLLAEHSRVPGLADGGAVIGNLYQDIDDAAWRRLQESFFTSDDERSARV